MAHSKVIGEHYEIDGKSITIMKLEGSFHGENWVIGIDLSGGDEYFNAVVTPAPALPAILEVIYQDKLDGNESKIRSIVASNRIAIRLWLEGVITRSNFKDAVEGVGVKPEAPFIMLKAVQFGKYTFPLYILPETLINVGTFATLDDQFRVVGSEEIDQPVLMLNVGVVGQLQSDE